ncbi:MAG: hypothetical protein PHE83_07140 [Opitutaceae bacterium]|nr:hypothetical protein [Opitutaceae bacterium]
MNAIACTDLVITSVVGLATGLVASYVVARIFYLKSLLDPVQICLMRCCPMRYDDSKEVPLDGVGRTRWILIMYAKLLHKAGFQRQARILADLLNTEMLSDVKVRDDVGSAAYKDSQHDQKGAEETNREKAKSRWLDKVASLYPRLSLKSLWFVCVPKHFAQEPELKLFSWENPST